MRLAFAAPPLTRFEPVEEDLVERIAGGLGLRRADVLGAQWLVNGPRWIGVRLASAEQVLGVQVDAATRWSGSRSAWSDRIHPVPTPTSRYAPCCPGSRWRRIP